MKCPECKAENRAERVYCGRCAATVACRCERCGFVNELDCTYCGGCASHLDGRASYVAPTDGRGTIGPDELLELLRAPAASSDAPATTRVVSQDELDRLFRGKR